MATSQVRRSRTPHELGDRVAASLVTALSRAQREGRVPSLVLTGGSIAVTVHEAVAASPDTGLVDWGRVDIWFGDERFVPAADPQRNAGQAARAMLDHLPFDPARVHEMPASDGPYGDDVDRAAAGYAAELLAAGEGGPPIFDVLMLGIGPDGHCASLFPGRHEVDDPRPAVAVRDSPKPPHTRITMTGRTLAGAAQVWWVAAGAEKAAAVARARSDADPHEVPAAGPRGRERTLWLLDDEAAGPV